MWGGYPFQYVPFPMQNQPPPSTMKELNQYYKMMKKIVADKDAADAKKKEGDKKKDGEKKPGPIFGLSFVQALLIATVFSPIVVPIWTLAIVGSIKLSSYLLHTAIQ